MESIKKKGRPANQNRDDIKDKRFPFVFSSNDIKKFGNRQALYDAVKKYVKNKKPVKNEQ